jgi:uncharacterized protein (TIGR04255 family)
MPRKQLKNKPLVEAILELHWALTSPAPGHEFDPHYKLLLGRLYDRLQEKYPEHEQLPTAAIPDELVGHVVQHRFRTSAKGWPLVQVGPGILTVNSTAEYTWEDVFRPRAVDVVARLYDAHPKRAELKITNLTLRYIDAVDFDYSQENAYDFLKDKLKVSVDLPTNLFDDTGVEKRPETFVWQSTFRCSNPKGRASIRFATGQKEGKPAIIWETMVQSSENDVPPMPSGFEAWIDDAHTITNDWFFKLIAGELERRFSGE